MRASQFDLVVKALALMFQRARNCLDDCLQRGCEMIDTLLWWTGLAVWVWIAFTTALSMAVATYNRSVFKRARET